MATKRKAPASRTIKATIGEKITLQTDSSYDVVRTLDAEFSFYVRELAMAEDAGKLRLYSADDEGAAYDKSHAISSAVKKEEGGPRLDFKKVKPGLAYSLLHYWDQPDDGYHIFRDLELPLSEDGADEEPVFSEDEEFEFEMDYVEGEGEDAEFVKELDKELANLDLDQGPELEDEDELLQKLVGEG